jgi:hypothetical protein
MFLIIVSPEVGEPFAHPVIPRVWVEAHAIAVELSRSFPDATVSVRVLSGIHVYCFQNGEMLHA